MKKDNKKARLFLKYPYMHFQLLLSRNQSSFHWNKQTMEVLPPFLNLAMSRGRASTNQTFFAGEVAFDFCQRVGHGLRPIFML